MVKTIMVHLVGTKADDAVLGEAITLAGPFGAHLDCVHIRQSIGQIIALAASGGVGLDTTMNVGELASQLEASALERSQDARERFDTLCASHKIALVDAVPASGTGNSRTSATFHERQGDEVDVLVHEVRGSDFGVVAGGGVEGGTTAATVAQMLLAGGRPLILAPQGASTRFPNVIAVAWKNTPQAAGALAAAMPLLAKAGKVVILGASEGSYEAGAESMRPVLSHLKWHGVNAEAREVLSAGRAASEAVLEAVQREGADLLVMGAYGRSRMSETIFGGFTQQVLGHTPLPVFLHH